MPRDGDLTFKPALRAKLRAIYVRSYPEEAAISLNGKPTQNNSGFLSAGTLISDLFPKTYTLTLTETGYEPWQEKVAVSPSLVTPLKYAVLIPQRATPAASGTATHFFFSRGTIIKENSAEAISVNGTVVGYGTLASATADHHDFLFQDASGGYRLYDMQAETTKNISATLAKDGIATSTVQNVVLDPQGGSQVVVVGQKSIWMLDLGTLGLTLIEKAPTAQILPASPAVNDSSIAWTRFTATSNMSKIVLYDRGAGNLRTTSTTVAGTTEKISWIRGNQLGILQSDGSLYLYDTGADSVQKLADDVRDFSTSEDGTMIAAVEHSNTEIFTQGDPTGYYRFNLPDVTDIQSLIWYRDDTHLFVIYPDHISFLDLQASDSPI